MKGGEGEGGAENPLSLAGKQAIKFRALWTIMWILNKPLHKNH